ncbi:MAG: riboflavin synthase [Betaproteobacteria bacterium]|nr:MAG: riboflavin synthase [Betaproteobacteria bacterium]
MFTGIVQAVGTIVRVAPLEIDCPALDLADVRVGDSISVQGVCLTVTAVKGASFSADLSSETLSVTVGLARAGAAVNLEKSLVLGERLGGHLVSGHIDGVGDVLTFAESLLKVRVPRELARYVARKGSICVDGVSLTVNRADADTFDAFLIPHTRKVTTLGRLAAGARVNLEVDLIARYVDRLLSASQ